MYLCANLACSILSMHLNISACVSKRTHFLQYVYYSNFYQDVPQTKIQYVGIRCKCSSLFLLAGSLVLSTPWNGMAIMSFYEIEMWKSYNSIASSLSWCSEFLQQTIFIAQTIPIASTFYEQLLCAQVPKRKKTVMTWLSFFAFLGSALVKAVCKSLMKLTSDHFNPSSKHIFGSTPLFTSLSTPFFRPLNNRDGKKHKLYKPKSLIDTTFSKF